VLATDDKSSLKTAWSGHVNHLNFESTNDISGMAEASVVKFCTQVGYVKSKHMDDKSSLEGRDQGHVIHFKFCSPSDISGKAEARVVKFCTPVGYIKSELSVDKTPLKEAWPGLPRDIFQLTKRVARFLCRASCRKTGVLNSNTTSYLIRK